MLEEPAVDFSEDTVEVEFVEEEPKTRRSRRKKALTSES